ncbi:hypothetical protein [Ammoniphilus resinae]|uniref:Uncharacterized protein n=1 Tax=Ammoniphilus resinae TaxID=861532 RepID=A0ABS4GP26_9BACL|nr:hypothetical protein [Ammoniphilus resinae]MBP1931872.1 hypothetical protein [Ammoniphilus resinae]
MKKSEMLKLISEYFLIIILGIACITLNLVASDFQFNLPFLFLIILTILYCYLFIKVPQKLVLLLLDITKKRIKTKNGVFIDSYKAPKNNYLFVTLYYVVIEPSIGRKEVFVSKKQFHFKRGIPISVEYLKHSKLIVKIKPLAPL